MVTTSPAYYGDFSDRWQPTLNTVANYIADARVLLQDLIPPYRYDDTSLIHALNITMLEASRLRAELFVFNLAYKGQVPAFQANDDTYVDIETEYRLAILNGMCAHAMKRDQEDIQDSRATAFMNDFSVGLIGKALPGVMGGSGPGGQR